MINTRAKICHRARAQLADGNKTAGAVEVIIKQKAEDKSKILKKRKKGQTSKVN